MITDIQAIDDWENKTAEVILAELLADRRTKFPIELGALLFTMNNRGMLTRLMYPDEDGIKWSGSVVTMLKFVRNSAPEFAPAINQWFSHITNDRNVSFDTSDAAFADLFDQIRQSFAGQTGMPTAADFDAMVDIGGGYRHAGVTLQQVTDAINSENQRIADDAQAVIDQAAAEVLRIRRGYVSVASQAAAAAAAGTAAEIVSAFSDALDAAIASEAE